MISIQNRYPSFYGYNLRLDILITTVIFAIAFLSAIEQLSSYYFDILLGILFLSALSLVLYRKFIYDNKLTSLTKTAMKLEHIKKPTPGKSMLDTIKDYGYDSSDIKELHVMTYDLQNEYLKNSDFAIKMKNIECPIKIVGYSNNSKTIEKIKEFYKNIEVIPLSYHLKSHYNIIIMNDNETYIWYEPHHLSDNEVNELKDGAYLLKAESQESSIKTFDYFIKQQAA